jgi:hypothetical protein
MKISFVLEEIKANQKRGVYKVKCINRDGTIGEFLSAKRGNHTYAERAGKKIKNCQQGFLHQAVDKTILFITLTVPYEKDYYGCEKSWDFISKESSPFIKVLKKMGMEKYLISLESCYQGGCHAHLITRWKKPFQTRERKGKFYLNDKNLSDKIMGKWIKRYEKWIKRCEETYSLTTTKRLITLEVCQDNYKSKKLFNYVSKWTGRGSDIEEALAKIENGTEIESRKKRKIYVQQLFTNYWGYKLRIRLFRTSKGLGTPLSN